MSDESPNAESAAVQPSDPSLADVVLADTAQAEKGLAELESGPSATDATTQVAELLDFMLRLGQAYLATGEQTALIELFLRRVATAQKIRRCRIVAYPTAIFISVHDGDREHVTFSEGPLSQLRLDQVAEVYTIGEEAQAGTLAPTDGLERIRQTMRRAPRFGTFGSIVGHVTLTVGLAAVLFPTLPNLVAAAALGAIVGGVKAISRDRPVLSAPLSVVAASLVAMLVVLATRAGAPIHPLHAVIPPLITFLPGATLTFGMVELAYGDMVSGAARLMAGFVTLVLLAFGLVVGAAVVGFKPDSLDLSLFAVEPLVAAWIPWAGALIFGIGMYVHFSAPPRSLPWILLVISVAFGAQRAAAEIFGAETSGFFGTLLATPLGFLIQQRFHGPPSMVTFLPSFWLLVPGSLGLISVTTMLTDNSAGIDGLVTSTFAFASIALGVLVGASLYKVLTEQLGLWRLQIGRAGPEERLRRKR